jgi:tetratricopeptide (TPR) repeat protein
MNAEARFYLGTALAGLGRFDDAIELFEQALKIDPGHTLARQALLSLQAQRN